MKPFAIKFLFFSGAGLAGVAIVVAVAATLMYFNVVAMPVALQRSLVNANPPEHSARYYPPDTLAYAWVSLLPGESQSAHIQDIWERLNQYPRFTDTLDEIVQELKDDTGIDFKTEFRTCIGPEISAGVIDVQDLESGNPATALNESSIAAMVMISVRRRKEGQARSYLTKWLAAMEEHDHADFQTDSYRGVKTWTDADAQQAYALTGQWLAFANQETALRAIIDRVEGNEAKSLPHTARFQAARASLPEERFFSAYLDSERATTSAAEFTAAFTPAAVGFSSPSNLSEYIPEWGAASAAWVDRGIVMQIVTPRSGPSTLQPPELDDPARLLPADTVAFVAGAFDPDVDHWRTALSQYRLGDIVPGSGIAVDVSPDLGDDSTLADALDAVLDAIAENAGIDLEIDLLNHFAGQGVIAVQSFDLDDVQADPANNPVNAAISLSYRTDGESELRDTMAEVSQLLQETVGLEHRQVDVGAHNHATVFDTGFAEVMLGATIGYRPGYVLHENQLTIGTTGQAIASTVAVQNGSADNLANDAEYRRALGHLPQSRRVLAYVNAGSSAAQIYSDAAQTEGAMDWIAEPGILGAIAISANSHETRRRQVIALTLFPE